MALWPLWPILRHLAGHPAEGELVTAGIGISWTGAPLPAAPARAPFATATQAYRARLQDRLT